MEAEDRLATGTKEMLSLLHHFEEMNGIRITIHDHIGVFTLLDGRKLLPGVNVHCFPCCTYNLKSRTKCYDHCRGAAMERARELKQCFTFTCWRGVTELVMPLYRGKRHALTVFAGAFQFPAFDLSSFSAGYKKLYAAMPLWSEQHIFHLECLLKGVGYALMRMAENMQQEYENSLGRKGEIMRFFHECYSDTVNVSDLAERLKLSESYTVHLLQQLFGKGFSALLTSVRLSNAEQLLQETEIPMRKIAEMTGFQNEFYFSQVFKKKYKMPPGLFRKNRTLSGPSLKKT